MPTSMDEPRDHIEDHGTAAVDGAKKGFIEDQGTAADEDAKKGLVEDYGTAIDERTKKIKCNYCDKVVGGFNRLKHHLGAVGSQMEEGKTIRQEVHIRNQWWLQYGGRSPQLRRFALRILSQSCSGATTFKLRRSLSERLHSRGRNSMERQTMSDAEFLHYNLRLMQSPSPGTAPKDNLILEDIDSPEDGYADELSNT
ncbi:hypothetical protein Taro_026100 [Colocasia esculenta]|uniref:HAT C-terminal dimerisation domain-containing protein n=1 Tax=Colocasia esculenta TaxID=4460 RepID=A0A843VG58_COLES|nr:hypothetical protein [Colocasia esculenta]